MKKKKKHMHRSLNSTNKKYKKNLPEINIDEGTSIVKSSPVTGERYWKASKKQFK